MSATAATSARELPRRSPTPGNEPLALRVLEVAGVVPVLVFLVVRFAASWDDIEPLLPGLAAWLAVVVVADLRPIPIWGSVEIAVSFPVLLASAMVFPPYVACALGFAGSFDARELRREISLLRGLFNRAHIAASVLAASVVFHGLGGDLSEWPQVVAVSFAALIADVAVNGSVVALGTHLLTGIPTRQVWCHMTGDDDRRHFLLSYVAFGLLAVLLAAAYLHAGNWSLVAFAVPLLLARQMFQHWKQLGEASEELLAKQQALLEVSQRIADERRDERLTMAAGIHDEVLPPLYQVHLMGQVLRQDLATGRLLELETDLPDLLKATQAANDALRSLIRDMRESPLGSRGLAETLRMLVAALPSTNDAVFGVDIEEVGGSALTQLLVYQIAREAIANAIQHAGASSVRVFLGVRDGYIRLVIQDDGRGFVPATSGRVGHLGLHLMRERADIAGGVLYIDSEVGKGTMVVARIPLDFADET